MKRLCILLLSLCLALTFTSCSLFTPSSPGTNSPSGSDTPPSGNDNILPSESTADNSIYCDPIEASAGKEISVPISIKNNKGICGFEIIITYDANAITPKSVTPSSNLSIGNFNDSIETMQDNSFSVVWSGSSNIPTDLELFVITFDINEGASENIVLQVSYIQENTIDEDIDEILLNCHDITINLQSED